ncbi:MAG: TIGR01841 family phasin [Dongiaceae bacterium]
MAKAQHAHETAGVKFPDFTQLYADYSRFVGDFGKFFQNGKAPMFDVEKMIAVQRKNVEALTVANQLAFEGVQAVVRRQAEIVRESVEDLTKMTRELTAVASPEDRLVRQTEIAKEAFETALGRVRELSGLIQKSSSEAVDVLSKRVSDNLEEVRVALTKANGATL